MYKALFIGTLAAFFELPPALLVARYLKPRRFPWWLIIPAILVGSWLLVNATVVLYYEYLGALIKSTPDPSPELLDRWAADGAKRVFALYFGWLHGLVYSIPFFVLYWIGCTVRGRRSHINRP